MSAGEELLPLEADVGQVIDGDTIRLADGRLVRYIGVDAPEVRRRISGEWIPLLEPYAIDAAGLNREWVEGKLIRLEYDIEKRDRYGRLLAYVYVGNVMVNAQLLEEGAAVTLTIPPNVRYAGFFKALAADARGRERGLWGPNYRPFSRDTADVNLPGGARDPAAAGTQRSGGH